MFYSDLGRFFKGVMTNWSTVTRAFDHGFLQYRKHQNNTTIKINEKSPIEVTYSRIGRIGPNALQNICIDYCSKVVYEHFPIRILLKQRP